MSKLIVVVGATGNQGGSVISSFLSDPKASKQFKLRGLTRDTTSAKAQKLASQGVEPFKADVDDVESLKKAFQGAYGVFAVTDFWATHSKQRETQQGKNIADACKATGVEHLVFSTLDNATKVSNGRFLRIFHFDSKAEVADYMDSLSIPLTRVMPGFYLSNFPGTFNPDKETGTMTYYTPIPGSTKIPIFDAQNDTGKFVKAIFLKPEQTIGREVRTGTTMMSFDEIASTLAKLRPGKAKGAKVVQIPREAYKKTLMGFGMPEASAEDLTEMFEFIENPGYFQGKKLDTDLLDEPATTFEQFVDSVDKWKE